MVYKISSELEDEITVLQRVIVDKQKPVLVIFESRDERVQGSIVNEFLNLLDPRVATYSHFMAGERMDCRCAMKTIGHEPAKGRIAVYDRSWYSWLKQSEIEKGRLEVIQELERYFVASGIILVKIFLDSDDEVRGVEEGWMNGPKDTFLYDDSKYEIWNRKLSSKIISNTGTAIAPWDIVKVNSNIVKATDNVIRTFLDRVNARMQSELPRFSDKVEPIYDNPRKKADLTKKAKNYRSDLLRLSIELNRLQGKLASSGRSLAVVFEGWDAAGKGGTIRRLTAALNPRGYYVNPVAAPSGEEKLHTYMWRFAVKMPKAGHIAIYDRSWYGRMMVEPIEGFCTEEEYGRSAREIRGFEEFMSKTGCIVLKFWMEISPEEQLNRFKARQENPVKQYKITDEDWRNREKWDVYEKYIDAMISATNAEHAPWIVVESEDKKYGRIKVLKKIVDTLSKELD